MNAKSTHTTIDFIDAKIDELATIDNESAGNEFAKLDFIDTILAKLNFFDKWVFAYRLGKMQMEPIRPFLPWDRPVSKNDSEKEWDRKELLKAYYAGRDRRMQAC